ncbi:MAG: hydrolase TatD [Chitinophagaceae bacterium]|nr:MAG: hydrolase TatD [Chitinophagaceae bacterium]
MYYLDIHTHHERQSPNVLSVQSLTLEDCLSGPISETKLVSVGLHPWFSTLTGLEENLRKLKINAAQKNVKLIGECGLDKLRGAKMEDQIYILTQQIILAEQLGKPLILHCVKAFSELIALKDKLNVNVPMIIHGFNKNEELGKQLLAKGFILSFGTSVLNAKSSAAKLVRETNEFFLETDTSEVPIEEIYANVAILKNCSVDELKGRIFKDWKQIINNKNV